MLKYVMVLLVAALAIMYVEEPPASVYPDDESVFSPYEDPRDSCECNR